MQEKIQKISPIKQRILQFADSLNISKRDFYKIIDVSRGTLESKTGITEDVLAKFIAAYPQISLTWLMTGSGDMLKSTDSLISENRGIIKEKDARIEDLKKQLSDKDEYIKHLLVLLDKDKADKKLPDTSSAVNVIGRTDAQTPPLRQIQNRL